MFYQFHFKIKQSHLSLLLSVKLPSSKQRKAYQNRRQTRPLAAPPLVATHQNFILFLTFQMIQLSSQYRLQVLLWVLTYKVFGYFLSF